MARKLLVEGLDWGVDDAALRTAFTPFGRVVEAKIATDWETGRSRGFGHVVYDDETAVNLAIETMDGARLAGKVLRVMVAPEQERRSTYRGGDYGRADPASAGAGPYRGGDYTDGRSQPGDKRVYRSADFGYAEGAARPSEYRGGDYADPRRRPPPEPEPPREAAAAPATPAGAPEPAAGDDAGASDEGRAPKRGGANKGGWQEGNEQGVGGQGKKTFG